MISTYIQNYELQAGLSDLSSGVVLNLLRSRYPSGTIKRIDIFSGAALTGGAAIFNIRVNGVSQFAGGARPAITAGNNQATKSGLSLAVVRGDRVTLDLENNPHSTVLFPLTFMVEVDDGVSGGETAASIGAIIAGATTKNPPVDADIFGFADSAAGNLLKKFTWLNLKTAIKASFDSVYVTGAWTATDSAIALFDGVTGELIKDSAKTLSTDGTFGSNSDAKIPTEKAIRTFVLANAGAAETAATIGTLIAGATSKTTPLNADSFIISDSAASNVGKKVTFTDFKAFLKTYFDTVYALFPTQTGNAGKFLQTDGSNVSWQKTPIEFGGACSDETTALTTGAAKLVFRSPGAVTLTNIRATLSTASTSGTVDVNIKKNGASIFTTKITIDATEKSSTTTAANYVLVATPPTFADDDEIQVDIDAAGTGAKGLKIFFFGVR